MSRVPLAGLGSLVSCQRAGSRFASGGPLAVPQLVCYNALRNEVMVMMYPFLTLDDGTEIVHSETKPDGRVKVYIERPDAKDCFHHATCWLPGYEWEEVSGFSPSEIMRFEGVVRSVAHLILEFAETGGFDNASGF